jgi:hypothetical protein
LAPFDCLDSSIVAGSFAAKAASYKTSGYLWEAALAANIVSKQIQNEAFTIYNK